MSPLFESINASWFFRFIKNLLKRLKKDNISATSAQLSYYLILSVFPFIIFLLNVLTFTPLAQNDVLSNLLEALPSDSAQIVGPIIYEIISSSSPTLLSVSLFASVWTGSVGVKNVIAAMDHAFDTSEKRNPFLMRFLSFLFTIILALIIVLTLMTQVFGSQIMSFVRETIGDYQWITFIYNLVQWLLPLVVIVLTFSVLYKFGPSFVKQPKPLFLHAFVGGIVATIGWGLVSNLFSLYVDNFKNYAIAYGSLGGIIALLVWLYLSSLMMMLGAEVTATLYHQKLLEDGMFEAVL